LFIGIFMNKLLLTGLAVWFLAKNFVGVFIGGGGRIGLIFSSELAGLAEEREMMEKEPGAEESTTVSSID
jgi:hypothetical protein